MRGSDEYAAQSSGAFLQSGKAASHERGAIDTRNVSANVDGRDYPIAARENRNSNGAQAGFELLVYDGITVLSYL